MFNQDDTRPVKGYSSEAFGRDFLASIVVFLVALPLCLGIAIASGVPPALGLIAGVIGGLVVGLLSGAPLQVSGPAAGVVSLVWEIVQTHGVGAVGIIVLIAGLLQLLLGYFKLTAMFRAVSPAVVQGMLAGIGVIIFSSQFHVMIGEAPYSHTLQNLLTIPASIQTCLFSPDGSHQLMAAWVGALTITIIVLWSLLPKRIQVVPSALLAVGVSVIVAAWLKLPINYVVIPDQFFSLIHTPHWAILSDHSIWIAAVTVAFVATAETMLSTTALDHLHSGPCANYDKEIMAQGVGNTLSGLLGALPITGVVVRSAANIQAGAQSRVAAMLHGLWIGLIVLLFPHVIEMIPIASLAAVLVYTGYKLVQPKIMLALFRAGKVELLIFSTTMTSVVSSSLLEGVLIGFVIASFRQLYMLSKLYIEKVEAPELKTIHLTLNGSATFVNLPMLSASLETLPLGWEVHVHIDQLAYIDHACLELLKQFEKRYYASHRGPGFNIEWDELTRKMRQEPLHTGT